VPGKATGEADRSDALLGVSRVQGYCSSRNEIRNQKEFHVVTVSPLGGWIQERARPPASAPS